MSICRFCLHDMSTGASCVVGAMHRDGNPLSLAPFGRGRSRERGARCGDCGVARGGLHHPGCDLQSCPSCGGQLLSCGCRFDEDGPRVPWDGDTTLGLDASGALTETGTINGERVVVHYADYPDSDVTEVHGIPCTTALRTVIDIAADVEPDHLLEIVQDALDRRLFTADEARRRLDEDDMERHFGAPLVRRALARLDC